MMKTFLRGLTFMSVLLACWQEAAGQGTAFTYQGRLNDTGQTANGVYNFQLTLFGQQSGGSPISAAGNPFVATNVFVTNGCFSLTPDFGTAPFNGQTLWMEIAVCTNTSMTFVTLTNRQELTPVPYAIYAESAGSAAVLDDGTVGSQGPGDAIAGGDMDSFIGGGATNMIQSSVNDSFIGGGDGNTIQSGDNESFIGGGTGNTIQSNSPDSAIVGGLVNTIETNAGWSFIGGGSGNEVKRDAFGSAVAGGTNNVIEASYYSAIVGGSNNVIAGLGPEFGTPSPESFIGGGTGNRISAGVGETIGGGLNNVLLGDGLSGGNTIAGGSNNMVEVSLAGSACCVIGGGSQNYIYGERDEGAVIAGGVENVMSYASEGVIAGGVLNFIDTHTYGSIGGGFSNRVGNDYLTDDPGGDDGTIGGGEHNFVLQTGGTVAGGIGNSVTGTYEEFYGFPVGGTVGGGVSNLVNGTCGTVPGGQFNVAANFAFAAGQNALATDVGSFVWGDGTRPAQSQGSNTFTVLATGGVYLFDDSTNTAAAVVLSPGATSWSTVSDRNAKKNIRPVDYAEVLNKLAEVPIEQWNYKWEKDTDVPNIGPMAQDFKQTFYPGRDDKRITTLEFDGVALAAIRGLDEKVEQKESDLKRQVEAQAEELKVKTAEIESLEKRLEKLEETVANGASSR